MKNSDLFTAEQLLPLVYQELRRLAAEKLHHEKPGQTLQPTALVHEAYLRLVGAEKAQLWDNRRHFFAAAAEAMRRILVENARRKLCRKHGGGFVREDLQEGSLAIDDDRNPAEVIDIEEALAGLAHKSPRKAELVKLRYFLGCTLEEAAEILGIAPATAEDDWTYAKAWLRRKIGSDEKKERLS
jgi:RNA polymerase sigma factor (TIGR02999 family)